MKEPITFIIPSFNREQLISRAIDSVLKQTNSNWELLIIDDGSNDGTKDLINSYLTDSRITYVYQENKGVSVARNIGINLASNNYIIFLDSDDELYPFLLEELHKIDLRNYDLIFWELKKCIDNKYSLWKPKNLGPMYNDMVGTFLAGSVCYKKEVLISAGSFDSKITFGENYELGIRISAIQNLNLNYIALPLAQQNLNTNNRESNSLENRLNSILYQYKKHEINYRSNLKAKSEINYLIGFLLEESNMKSEALDRYKLSWFSNLFHIKALLKILYLKHLK
ncbi:glycosyltransferase involved in cell wall biosynthesis [Gillisia mitskevichiae]|uniref:Glycosyltransferase involved in cell wall biosynthesis n=1 Tax=Gillisia mitskevichiae TaxID=270921 RepID=A0A495PPI5_9FLAO|nr:glycosyltransferase family 2 protein [Gillisia mitskevichiae]RKS50579.1 glycosyltransferase involved in cell wall biosynthesis [Gillisia mitskevichiae]